MNGSQSYEKIVKAERHIALKITVIISYVLLAGVFAVVALANLSFSPLILVMGALVTFGVVKFTWKYLQLEYEYSFSYGTLCVSKIYGKRTRKQLVEADIKSLIMIAPSTDENIAKAERLEAEEKIEAVSSERAENVWLALTGDKDEKRVLIFFESDERALAILKSVNPYAFSKRI